MWSTCQSLSRGVAISIILAYQNTLSLLMLGSCRFSPSCSAYAHSAIEKHGLIRGSWLSIRRLVRCGPFGPAGPDLVP